MNPITFVYKQEWLLYSSFSNQFHYHPHMSRENIISKVNGNKFYNRFINEIPGFQNRQTDRHATDLKCSLSEVTTGNSEKTGQQNMMIEVKSVPDKDNNQTQLAF